MPGVAVAQKKKSEGLLQSLGGEVSTGVDEFRVLLFDTFASMYNSLVSALVRNFQKDNKKEIKKDKIEEAMYHSLVSALVSNFQKDKTKKIKKNKKKRSCTTLSSLP